MGLVKILSVFLIGTTLASALGPQVQSQDQSPRATFHNPILDFASPDPFIHFDGTYYYLPLSQNNGITLYKSRYLTDFRNAEKSEIYRAPDGLMGLWAPEIHYIWDEYYIYFALDDGDNANHRMYVIKALDRANPLGEWTREQRMVVPGEDFWAIDATPLLYGNGQLYLIWSGWPNIDSGFPQNLYIAPMSDPMTISGPRVEIRTPHSHWDQIGAPLNEGPQIIQHMGRTFVIFSGSGSWTPDYCLGMMGIDELKDPLVKSNWWDDVDNCVFWRNDAQSVYGTGHASFTISPDGTESWIIYHAMERADGGWENRTARAERFGWNPDHSPAFPRPSGFHVPLQTPSGQPE